jgi:hypothetical protein
MELRHRIKLYGGSKEIYTDDAYGPQTLWENISCYKVQRNAGRCDKNTLQDLQEVYGRKDIIKETIKY